MRGVLTAAICAACCIAPPAGGQAADPNPAAGRYEFESKHMGTLFRVVLYAPDKSAADAAAAAVFARVAELDRVMSDYNPNSELMRLCKSNDARPGEPVKVGDDLFAVLAKAEEVSRLSDGAFDVTVGPLVRLWRNARRTQELPDPKELAAAKEKVGYRKVTLNPRAKTVTLAVPGMRLDLGGIGKGFAADAGLDVLNARGVTRALVAASGDIAVADPPPGKDGWVVDVAPIGTGKPARRLLLANAAVSTSGDLFQHVEIAGVRYSHVLDPATGLGLTGRRSVTVVAKRDVFADSLTKAASVLPPAKALAVIGHVEGAEAYIVVKETDDAPEAVTESKGFRRFQSPGTAAP